MDFRNLETFLKVSELHSFSLAATQLGYSQSTVSTQIAKLEHELGYALFDRLGHRITLTEKGHTFLQYAGQITLLTEQLQQSVTNQEVTTGRLRIAMADSLCSSFFNQILLTYQKHYPAVMVNIRTGLSDDMFNWLAHNEVDMVYTLDNRLSRSDLVVLTEETVPVHFYARADHPYAGKTSVTIAALQQYPVYLTEKGVSYRRDLDYMLGNLGKELRPSIELGDVKVIEFLLTHSDGIGFLPEFAVREALQHKILCQLPVNDLNIFVWKHLIYHRGKFITPAMQGLIDLFSLTTAP